MVVSGDLDIVWQISVMLEWICWRNMAMRRPEVALLARRMKRIWWVVFLGVYHEFCVSAIGAKHVSIDGLN